MPCGLRAFERKIAIGFLGINNSRVVAGPQEWVDGVNSEDTFNY